jgi:hypothetical protein
MIVASTPRHGGAGSVAELEEVAKAEATATTARL